MCPGVIGWLKLQVIDMLSIDLDGLKNKQVKLKTQRAKATLSVKCVMFESRNNEQLIHLFI